MSYIISQEYLDKLQKTREIEGVYLANSLQQGFIYHALNQGNDDDAYIVQLIWKYENKIELNNLKKAWYYAQIKYQSLRLRFGWEEELIQVIDKTANLDWRYIDLSSGITAHDQEQEIKKIQEQDRVETYSLDNGNLFRVYLIKQKEELYTCIFSNHHAILDGWSTPILLGYIHETYLKLQNKETIPISIDYSYRDAQRYLWKHKDDNNIYWDNYVSKIEERSDLSCLLSSSNKHVILSEYKHIKDSKELILDIQDKLYYDLKKLSQEEGITLNTILQYVWHKVLSIYGRNNQTIVGTTVSGRDIPINNIENSVGLYINTLPLIVDHSKQSKIIELLKVIQNDINEINSRSNVNLAKLQKRGERLFDSLFIYENYPSASNTEQQGKVLKVRFQEGKDKLDYPLGVVAYEINNQLTLKLKYAGELFCGNSIRDLLLTVKRLLEQIVNNCQLKIQYLSYLTGGQNQQIVYDWNQTDQKYPNDKTINQLFEEQVEKTPDNIAIIYEETKLTYKELNEKANHLANYLKQVHDIKPDTLVALCLDRSEYVLIAILAVLKAGGAYVPIDPNYPDDRVKYILKDISTKLVLTNEIHKLRLEETSKQKKVLAIDSKELQKQLSVELASNPKTEVKSADLAYVIYTSGTTGNPKGVMIEHRSVINYISNIKSYNLILPEDKVDFSTNTGFDLTVTTTICALCAGSQIVIYKDELQDLESYKRYLSRTSVNVAKLVPSYFELLIDYLPFTKINKIILGGEKLSLNIINKLRDLYSDQNFNLTIWDEYGPTEATVGTCNSKICLDKDLTIGKPYSNYRILVLDNNLMPLPIGGIGELYIGGVGLARGYLNRPDLTSEKFIANPFQTKEEKLHNKNTRLYKTGDLVRWLADGNLEYIGRNDFQVKVRGYRIELGEIENVISSYDGIKQSVVIAKEHKSIEESLASHKYLVGYYVSESKLNEEDIISYLRKKLPEYMIPSVLVHLKELPLIINGKLDRKALPEPEFSSGDNYVAPRNEVEKQVCKIWADILGLAQADIGISTNFFDLGGNSILIIRLKIKIEKNLKINNLNISDLFKYPTIKSLSDYLFTRNTLSIDTNKIKNINNRNNFVDDIAVIAMSGAFSSLDYIEEYWDGIVNGKESLEVLSEEACKEREVLEYKNKNFVPVSGVVKDIDKFDPNFWNLSFNDAVLMDPQIRKFLEHSWVTLEKSGYIKERAEIKIAVFAGMSSSEYYTTRIQGNEELLLQASDWEIQNMNNKDYLATRVSYCLGLTGISLNINTACSTSLVAIVEACKNLSMEICDLALAGGVSLSMPENHGYIYQDGMILAKDGHCRVFDKGSSGTVPGSGIGVVALKRLKDAVRDRDNIIAVIKGYATNNDGNRKVGYTAPSVIGQTECILKAQNMAKTTSDTIDYVECHGTGTSLGDPIEIAALHDTFKSNLKQEVYNCILGAVKANIGHADSAAGVAGFIKVCKMLQEKVIPPQINFETPNPNLHLEQTNFKIITTAKEWISNYKNPRRAGVSAFGIGGTNAHVIVEEYTGDKDIINKAILDQYYILLISAKSIFSYQHYCKKLLDFLTSKPEVALEDIAYTLQYKREYFCYRNIIVCKDKLDAINQLKKTIALEKLQQSSQDIIFMFSGQGVQYQDMAKNLYNTEPVFRSAVDECCKIISGVTKINFKEFLYPKTNNKANDYLKETKWAQPALFTICYSIAKLLESFSINASAYIGHSIGEYVAATLSGVFNLEDALKVVIKRGELMQTMPKGSMISINISAERIHKILPDNLEIAVYNSPEYIVVSGEDKEIESFESLLDKFDIKYLKLYTSHAFHSKMMDGAAKEFEQYLKKYINLNKPSKRFISNITGDFISNKEAVSTNYWASHIRQAVQFSQGIEKLISEYKNAIYLEVGPGKGLSTFVSQHKHNSMVNSISTLPSIKEFCQLKVNDSYQFYKAIGQLWCYGYDITWEKVWKTNINNLKFVDIPTYQFEKNKCWIDLPKIINGKNKLQINSSTEWLYQLTWQRIEKIVTPTNKKLTIKNCWLIFRDKLNVIDSFIYLLNSTNQIVIIVDYSELNENILIQENQITINLYNEFHYQALGDYLTQNKYDITYIIHAWTITSESLVAKSEFYQYLGFYSLFLLQDKLFSSLAKEANLVLLTNGLNKVNTKEIIHPNKGTMLGAIKAIPHEMPKIKAFTLDINFDEYINDKYLLSLILNTKNYTLEPNFSIRGGYLWKEVIEPICISNDEYAPIINNNDLILISGGLGGVGLAIAKEISKYNQIKFVLVNRLGIGGNYIYKQFQLDSLEFIRNNNCEVEIRCCDISNLSEVNELITFIKAKYGKINGVIHAAGSAPLNISERNLVSISNAIKGKVLGAENLFNVLKNDSLKFFVMTSSLASLMGDIGRLEYCAANSYLDVLSNLETDNIDNLISINWPGWSNIGMSIKSDIQSNLSKSMVFDSMSNILSKNNVTEDEGSEIFYKLINRKGYNQIAISKIDILRIKIELSKSITGLDSKFNNKELTDVLIEENSTELENKVAQIFCQILGSHKFSKHDSYFELGGDSLSAIKLINKLNKELHIIVTMTVIFKQNTVAKLANYIDSNLLKKSDQLCPVDEGEL